MLASERPGRPITSAEHQTIGHRYRRRRPVLGTILILFGVPATVAGYAMIVIHDGEPMVLDGLPWFVLCFSGTIAFTLGFLMFRPGERLPSLRKGYRKPDPGLRRGLLLYRIGAPLIGFGLSCILCARLLAAAAGWAAQGLTARAILIAGIVAVLAGMKMLVSERPGLSTHYPGATNADRAARHPRSSVGVVTGRSVRSERTVAIIVTALGFLALIVFSWQLRTHGLDGRDGWIALGLIGLFTAGFLRMIWPDEPRPDPAIYEARFSSRIAGCLAAIGIVAIPVTWMLALSGNADPDTRWSVAIVFLAFATVLAAIGGWQLRDRRVVLRVDDDGLFWRKIGIIPWDDVEEGGLRVGRRVCNLMLTIRENDGARHPVTVDLTGLDRTVEELATALRERGVRLGPDT